MKVQQRRQLKGNKMCRKKKPAKKARKEDVELVFSGFGALNRISIIKKKKD